MLCTRLREFRTMNGLSQTDMAKKLNITRQAYNHYETGRRTPPLSVLLDIGKILDIDIATLSGDSNSVPAEKTPAPELDERTEKNIARVLELFAQLPQEKVDFVIELMENMVK